MCRCVTRRPPAGQHFYTTFRPFWPILATLVYRWGLFGPQIWRETQEFDRFKPNFGNRTMSLFASQEMVGPGGLQPKRQKTADDTRLIGCSPILNIRVD